MAMVLDMFRWVVGKCNLLQVGDAGTGRRFDRGVGRGRSGLKIELLHY